MDIEELEHRHFIDRIAFLAGIVSGVALFPQVWVTVSTGAIEGLSITAFSVIAVNSLVWLVYAMHRGLIALGISSLLNSIAGTIMVLAYVWHTFI